MMYKFISLVKKKSIKEGRKPNFYMHKISQKTYKKWLWPTPTVPQCYIMSTYGFRKNGCYKMTEPISWMEAQNIFKPLQFLCVYYIPYYKIDMYDVYLHCPNVLQPLIERTIPLDLKPFDVLATFMHTNFISSWSLAVKWSLSNSFHSHHCGHQHCPLTPVLTITTKSTKLRVKIKVLLNWWLGKRNAKLASIIG